jgi:hypothetical protein
MKRFKQSQKLRVILNGIAVYTTVKQVRGCQFGFYEQNAAAQKALESLEFSRTYSAKWDGGLATGTAGTWEGLHVQLDLLV